MCQLAENKTNYKQLTDVACMYLILIVDESYILIKITAFLTTYY